MSSALNRSCPVVVGGSRRKQALFCPLQTRVRASVLIGLSALAGFGATAARAQDATQVGEVIVTGTRIVRDGYLAPIPTTVLGAEDLKARANTNLADVINTLPAVTGSATPRSVVASDGLGQGGINSINLRGLGVNRTLVLLDGVRSVASSIVGAVDINEFPQALVSRVDVVTGGASAAYGSDALSGVVNFILDKTYTGLKGEAQGGVTTYGDDRQYQLSLTGGTKFAGGRGHLIASAEYASGDGVKGAPRDWFAGWQVMMNPAYTAAGGQPQLLVRPNVGSILGTKGALVTAGPLRGLLFGPGGSTRQFVYGDITSATQTSGGDWRESEIASVGDLDAPLSRYSLFARASYELTDNIEVYGQASRGVTETTGTLLYQFNLGNITIRRDNAFLPADVGARMDALGLTTLTVGSMNRDLGGLTSYNKRTVDRMTFGVSGKFDAMGSAWNWQATAQRGVSRVLTTDTGRTTITQNYTQAIDAVRLANGSIVCRSTITAPTNGCVPYNVLGTGVSTDAARAYVFGDPFLRQKFTQDLVGASIRGEPFATWAGPVSMAMGVEHRSEKLTATVDTVPTTFVGNFNPSMGAYKVTEGFVETVVPLAKDQAWARQLDLSAALRQTSYTTSGSVTAYKVGLSYQPFDDLRFRATRSRDIRAPNMNELFQAGVLNQRTVNDPARGGALASFISPTIGNPDLRPEIAKTTGIGAVYRPSGLPGFSASVDYYKISIRNAIILLTQQQILDRCFGGNTLLCQQVTRNSAGVLTEVVAKPVNLASQVTTGFDLEAGYRTPLSAWRETWRGNLSIRALATHVTSLRTNDGLLNHEYVGEYGANGLNAPRWRWTATLAYDNGPWRVSVTQRGLSSGVYNNSHIQCTTGCPASTVANMTIDNNHIPAIRYTDIGVQFSLPERFGRKTQLFANVDNLFNRDPNVVAGDGAIYLKGTNAFLYDLVGRMYRIGLRFEL